MSLTRGAVVNVVSLLGFAVLATMAGSPVTTPLINGAARVQFRLPRQGVSLLLLTW